MTVGRGEENDGGYDNLTKEIGTMNQTDKRNWEEGGREADLKRRAKESAGFTENEMAAVSQILPKRYTPIGKMIAVQRINVIQQTRGGVLLPEKNQVFNLECWIIAAGPKCEQVKRGDRVLVSNFAGAASTFYKGEDV